MKPVIDKKAADRAVTFFQGLRHTTGQWAGEPFQLQDWQTRILVDVFGTKRPDGSRQYRNVWIEIPKKNGKSEFAAGLALYLLLADKEPGAQVYSAATDRDQAGIVFNAAEVMVNECPELSSRCKPLPGTRRIVAAGGSFYRVLSSESYSKHGYNISGLVVDEVHAHKNRDLIDVLTKGSGAARRQPLFIYITTAGTDRNSIGWEKHEYALRVLKFRYPEKYAWVQGTPIDDPSWYVVIYGLNEDEDWALEENWHKANPALGTILKIEDFRKDFQDAQQNLAEENIFKQLRLNIWVKSSVRWMKMSGWDACEKPLSPEELAGKDCYGGLDLASTTDLAALALVFPTPVQKEGDSYLAYDVLMKYWIPEEMAADKEKHDGVPYRQWARDGWITLTPGNVIDYDFIEAELLEACETYQLKELAFDRWGASKLVQNLVKKGFSNDPKVEGIPIIPFGQGFASMNSPTRELMNQVLLKRFRHGDNPVLRWNADNTAVEQGRAAAIKPVKPKGAMKIDGIVASIMALDRATKHTDEYGPSIYETQGVKSF